MSEPAVVHSPNPYSASELLATVRALEAETAAMRADLRERHVEIAGLRRYAGGLEARLDVLLRGEVRP